MTIQEHLKQLKSELRRLKFPFVDDHLSAIEQQLSTPMKSAEGLALEQATKTCNELISEYKQLIHSVGNTDEVPEGYVLVKDELVNFLLGAESLDGMWFGDKHPDSRHAFWWRKELRKAMIRGKS